MFLGLDPVMKLGTRRTGINIASAPENPIKCGLGDSGNSRYAFENVNQSNVDVNPDQ